LLHPVETASGPSGVVPMLQLPVPRLPLVLPRLLAASLACALLALPAAANFSYQVYDGDWNALPNFTALTPITTGQSATIGVSVTTQVDTFGLVFTRALNAPTAGAYEFFTNSDDGSRLYIDGSLVVDNDGLHGPRVIANTVNLTAGAHTLRVEFFEKTGGEVLEVGYRTGNPAYQPIPANGQLSFVLADLSAFGEWGPVIPWPEIAISAANLPDGRVLTWSSTEIDSFPAGPTFSHASVFDPGTGAFLSVDSNFHDMFCAGISSLEDGTIVASGGNPSDRRTSSFDPDTLTWSPREDMIDLRWYGANATLPDNTIFSTFAKDAGNRSEVYDPETDTWTATPNASMQTLVTEQNAIQAAANPTGAFSQEWWAHIAVTPAGDVFQGGPTPTWHVFDPIGGSSNVVLGQPIGDVSRMYGNAVTYDAGKVLLIGGGDRRANPPTSVSNVYRVDLNGPSPTVTAGAPMNYPRALLNSVTLPDGKVLVIGGNTVARIFSDEGSVLPAEIYDPAADTWTVVDSITIPRNYHSTALLLKDARVLSAGGGACGPGCAANHLDGQIYSPPYLFEANDTPALRPTLTVPPGAQVAAGDDLVVSASAGTTSFSVVRLSGTTHHLNTDQRFLPLSATDNGDGTFTVSFPANPNVLIVGNYWLFALDADGTPSVGQTVQVVRALPPPPPPDPSGVVYVSDLVWTSEQNGFGPAERDRSNGEAGAADGGTLTLAGVEYPKGIGVHAYSEIRVPLAGLYERFLTDIGLDDEQDGQCGNVLFEVTVDGTTAYASGSFTSTTPTASIDLDVTGASFLILEVHPNGGSCGDHGDWANARLVPVELPGYRYYRFRPTKLRDDPTANSIQLAELSLFAGGVRQLATAATNPGGSNPAGEEPIRANDANVNTKWLDFNRGSLVYDFGDNIEIDAYTLTTANDAPERDPVRWYFEGSVDGIVWEVLDYQTLQDFPTPAARLTQTSAIDLVELDTIAPLPDAPRHSTTLIVEVSSGADRIWNVNPDNDSVSVSDAAGNLVAEIAVGDAPWSLARQPGADRVFVTNKRSSSISVIDSVSLAVIDTVPLARGAQPHGIVFGADGASYFVVLEALARVEKRLAADDSLVGSLALSGRPRHLSMRFDDSRLYVSNFVTPPIPGEHTLAVNVASGAAEIFVVSPGALTWDGTIVLPHDGRPLSESQGPGMPNYLGPAVVAYANDFAYVPTKKDNVQSGVGRGIGGMTFESTVRANTSRINLGTGLEDPGFRVDHDNSSVATGAALSGDDRYVFVTLETSRELAVYDVESGFQLMRLPTGRAPQSVALSTDGSRAYVHNFMDRSISRFDLTEMLQTHLPATNLLAPIDVVSTEALSPTVLLGKQHFYDAADDRIALNNYISCASCHRDGDDDGRVWDLTGLGEGVRRTIPLRGRGAGHGRPHWTGNFDEIQDFENQIRFLNLGTGFLSIAQFTATQAPLGAPKTGLSADLDALAAYVESLTAGLESPHRPGAGTLSASAQAGRSAFASQGCLGCHAMPQLTDSASAARHDIGTIDGASGQRLGGPLDGFDTPGLLGAWANAPYLHDGEAQTLEAAIAAHDAFAGLPPATLANLAAFLREAEASDLGGFADADGDGTVDLVDPAPADPCEPTAFVAVCAQDTDGDGVSDFAEGELADSDGDGLFDFAESSIADADLDTLADQADPANANACVPTAFVAACAQDTDGDGATDFAEGELADTDGDGLLDYTESSIIDADGDTVADQADPANTDLCVPDRFLCPERIPMMGPAYRAVLTLLLVATGTALARRRGRA
jgi:YVTN family beta-propeller protein